MRVANIIEEARVGGPQRRIAGVASRLKLAGVETVVIGPVAGSDGFRRLLEGFGVAYVALPLRRLSRGLRRVATYGLFFAPEVWRLSRILKRGKFDLLHVSGGSWQIKGVVAGKIAGLPILWHLNDTHSSWPVRMVFRVVSTCLPTSFIVSGRRVRDYYLPLALQKKRFVAEIRPPVATEVFDPERVEPDRRLSGRNRSLVVLVGSVNPNKGLDTFVEAAAYVAAAVPDVEFWIIGPTHDTQTRYRDGLDRSIEEKGLSDRIRFFGAVSESASVLAAADVVVCTSRAESGPMVVWEAMSMAKPVVSTDVGDVRLILEAGSAGFVVPVGAAAAVGQRVVQLLADEGARKAMGMRGREVAKRQLSLEKCVQGHLDAYRHVAARRA